MENHESPADFGKGSQGEVRRWLMELTLADKRDKDYRESGKKIWDVYRGKARKRNSFNILWSNTETLAPAVFNSPPQPNVRRRFKDADPVGKVVSTVLERCLEFQTDTEPFMSAVSLDVLDMLLPGRGVSRIRYVPSIVPSAAPASPPVDEALSGDTEEVAWEQVVIEHVQWDDFRHGPGKTWGEVPWEAFRHRLKRDDIKKLAGDEIAGKVTLDEPDDEDLKKSGDLDEVFKSAEVWEIWDKDTRRVLFITKSYKDGPLKVVEDPLKLSGFFPNPKPLLAVQDSASLEPIPLYEQYREQADELNRISTRINKLIDACKVRGIYDATLTNDISQLMKAGDNELIPMQNAAAWMEKGGIEKAIYMMPVEDIAKTLALLYTQRDAAKQVIYEITGIADVMRGSTDPNETLGAQQLKAQWGGQRVQAMQREVQRYARDHIRLMGEVVAERFQPDTLLRMTGLKIPTQVEVQQAAQQMAAPAQATGQPPQQPEQPPVTLEQVMQVLRDDATRMFKVDVETDSMVAATMQQDMQSMEQLLGGITSFVAGIGPAVQAGAIPIEAVKETILAVTRRARLGSVVEDAFDKMQPPKPQADPAQLKADAEREKAQAKQQLDQQALQHTQQLEQSRLQSDQQLEQMRAQADMAIENNRLQGEMALAQRQAEHDRQLQVLQAQNDAANQARQAETDAKLEVLLAYIKQDTAVEVAHINNEGKKEIAANQPKEPPRAD